MKLPNPDLRGDKLTILNKEIDLIESVITRMAQNSFYMKGWCITLVAAIFSLSDNSARQHVYLPLALMTAAFWWLDSYYLQLERAYRKLYVSTIRRRVEKDDWLDLFNLNPKGVLKDVQSVPRIMASKSEWPLYFILILTLLIFGWRDVGWLRERCLSRPMNCVVRFCEHYMETENGRLKEKVPHPVLQPSECLLHRPTMQAVDENGQSTTTLM